MAFRTLFAITVRLHFRNRMAVLYGHLFPALVLLAFLGLYSRERPLLARHLGEILAVTALSGACFGLPTALAAERERGVWRRLSLAPLPLRLLFGPTLLARFCLLLLAGAVQLLLGMLLGMPAPSHPYQLAAAFALAAFAFLGLGVVLAMIADTVGAAQALAQCVFLPMLVLGGVVVRVEALPSWARTLSAFLPGRYAVEALQACATGEGLRGAGVALLLLALFGLAAVGGGLCIFRWETSGARLSRAARSGAAAALAAWMLVGYAAATPAPAGRPARQLVALRSVPTAPPEPTGAMADSAQAPVAAPPDPAPAAVAPPLQAIDRDVDYSKLPPDDGLVSPFARDGTEVPEELASDLECIRMMLPGWGPGRVPDPEQRVRNYLYVAAVPDVYQTGDLEQWIPLVVAERLAEELPAEELARTLHHIATHPAEGDLAAAGQLRGVCFDRPAPEDTALVRERVTFYALKLLGRATGRLPARR